MKRPKKEPQVIEAENYTLFQTYTDYTPDDLREMANEMEQKGIISIKIEQHYEDWNFIVKKMETKSEAERRYKKEYTQWKRWKEQEKKRKEQHKKDLIKEAKKLGLKLVENA